MGRTAKFLRSLLGSKKSPRDSREKKSKWALSKPADYKLTNEDPLASPYADGLDANKHAIAVAAATAAVAEAALAAAQAAAEVVRLTSGGGGGGGGGSGRNVPAYVSSDRRRVAAAIMIQSAFRAYLAKRALRALKGLVKLQALVRGHIVRKQSADMLRRMQAMARIQARASATRSHVSESSKPNIRLSNYYPSGAASSKNYNQWSDMAKHDGRMTKQSRIANRESPQMDSNWLNHWIEQYSWNNRHATSPSTSRGDDERSTKILEIDTWKPRQRSRPSEREFSKITSFSRLSAKLEKPNPSILSEEVSSVVSAKEVEQVAVWTAESSPRVHSASSRPTSNQRGMFTPTRSVLSDYLGHPSYMANTESSRAKVRSQSAPKQRMQLEELGASSTFGRNAWESDAMSEKGYAISASYRSNAYLKRQGTHTTAATTGVSFSYGHRF